jgi:hypothetical protein
MQTNVAPDFRRDVSWREPVSTSFENALAQF